VQEGVPIQAWLIVAFSDTYSGMAFSVSRQTAIISGTFPHLSNIAGIIGINANAVNCFFPRARGLVHPVKLIGLIVFQIYAGYCFDAIPVTQECGMLMFSCQVIACFD
jgi:hypothetical protein